MWELALLALTQLRTSMAGVVGLDFPAIWQMMDEFGIDDEIDRQDYFNSILHVYEVFQGYQGEYRRINQERADAEAAVRRELSSNHKRGRGR